LGLALFLGFIVITTLMGSTHRHEWDSN